MGEDEGEKSETMEGEREGKRGVRDRERERRWERSNGRKGWEIEKL